MYLENQESADDDNESIHFLIQNKTNSINLKWDKFKKAHYHASGKLL